MFKEGQVYKIKVELSPERVGFGRAIVVAVDPQRIYIQLKSSKGIKLNVPGGAKIWFVGSSVNNRFNGLWSSEVKGTRMINGKHSLECRLPRFEQSSQKRVHARFEMNAPAELIGDEWKGINAKVITRNISRFGLGFYVEAECSEQFSPGMVVSLLIHMGDTNLEARCRVVNCRFNWLLNRTEVGAELSEMDASAVETVERAIAWLGTRSRGTKSEFSESGSLARWVTAGKDDLSFVKKTEQTDEDEVFDSDFSENDEEFDKNPGF